jgi:adenosylcobinamide kinase / adenosylcobinamide-phosphate guanylyltransferase
LSVRALFLGGARSGKSARAEELARGLGGEKVLYVATAVPDGDAELEGRVREHRARRPAGWGTLELDGGDLRDVLAASAGWDALLLDSLTLWVSARMEDEGSVLPQAEAFLWDARSSRTPVVLVSDEVGLGVVPESPAGRRFRDLLGAVNQRAAAAAQEVYLCVAGLGVRIK